MSHLGTEGALTTYLSQILERVLGSMVGRVSTTSSSQTCSIRGAESGWPRATTLLGRLGLGEEREEGKWDLQMPSGLFTCTDDNKMYMGINNNRHVSTTPTSTNLITQCLIVVVTLYPCQQGVCYYNDVGTQSSPS